MGDERLNTRTVLLVAASLAAKPTGKHPQRLQRLGRDQGGLPLLEYPRADSQAVLLPHCDCSVQRMRRHAVVLNIQGTTELDYNGRASHGLGPLSY